MERIFQNEMEDLEEFPDHGIEDAEGRVERLGREACLLLLPRTGGIVSGWGCTERVAYRHEVGGWGDRGLASVGYLAKWEGGRTCLVPSLRYVIQSFSRL